MPPVHTPLILYVPGLLPKPEPSLHKEALFRCLIAGVERQAPAVAASLLETKRSFDIIAWTFDFYREHRDIGLDRDAIEAVITQAEATEDDIVEAASPTRRVLRSLYRMGNLFPFLIPHLANERIQLHLRDLRRYAADRNGIAEHVREMLKVPLRAARASGRRILLIGHSMGSVIAYDSLWQLTHESGDDVEIDLLLTMGSPLGQNYVRRHILGRDRQGAARYPAGIRRWVNLTAVGDLTAIDPRLARDFAEMVERDLVPAIEDIEVFNYFRSNGELNVHAEYGYLSNKVTARLVADWWRAQAVQAEPTTARDSV